MRLKTSGSDAGRGGGGGAARLGRGGGGGALRRGWRPCRAGRNRGARGHRPGVVPPPAVRGGENRSASPPPGCAGLSLTEPPPVSQEEEKEEKTHGEGVKVALHRIFDHYEWPEYQKNRFRIAIFELQKVENCISRLCPSPLPPSKHPNRVKNP